MKLSLLTPPTESPRDVPHVPIPKGWPGEREIAVDTRALPNSLPLTPMDPGAASAPFEALARLGATGANVSTQALNIVLEAEARKREATNLAEVDRIYTETAIGFEQEFERHKATSDHDTFRPGFDELWKQASERAMEQAKDPEVARHLARKLQGYRITKNAEASNVDRTKFLDFQQSQFQNAVQRDTKLATEASDPAELEYHMRSLESTFRAYGRAGSIPLKEIQAERTKALDHIRTDRADQEAYLNPLSMLQRVAQGETFGLETKELRTLSERAENRLRTLRSDQENMEARERRVAKEKQDDLAITWRQRITENYGAGGSGLNLVMGLNAEARALGENNHKELIEMERVYRERALKPPKVIKSDKGTVGAITTAYRDGNVRAYTNADLLRLLDNDTLDEADHRYLAGLRAQVVGEQKADAKRGEADPEHIRKEQIKDGEKTIKELLERGDRLKGEGLAVTTGILSSDALTEYHQRLTANPAAIPEDVATDVIVARIHRIEKTALALPYKTKEDVEADYQAGNITKATATRYHRLLKAMEKSPKGGTGAVVIPKTPGFFERLFGGGDESPMRQPVKP